MARLGLELRRAVRAVNPRLVMVSTCLMGQSGPLHDFAGFGNLAGAMFAGFYDLTGWPDRPPAGPYSAYTDYIAPASPSPRSSPPLDHARRTGEGQYLDLSQMECGLQFLAPALLDDSCTVAPPGAGNADARHGPPRRVPGRRPDGRRPLDGRGLRDRRAVAGPGRAGAATDLAGLSARRSGWPAGRARRGWWRAWTAGQDAADPPGAAPGRRRHRPPGAEQRRVRGRPPARPATTSVGCRHPIYGDSFVEGPAFQLSRTPGGPTWAGPTMGQHTQQVLADFLHYDEDKIADLVIAGALD